MPYPTSWDRAVRQAEMGNVTIGAPTDKQLGGTISDLYTRCCEVLHLYTDSAISQTLWMSRETLKLWGSGLFGESSLVGLDCLPTTAANESLLRFVIGTLADIARSICETVGSDLPPEWADVRSRLYATLCLERIIDEMLEDTSISGGPNHDIETIPAYIERCCHTVDGLVECLFEVLPSIGTMARVSELDAERNRGGQAPAYIRQDIVSGVASELSASYRVIDDLLNVPTTPRFFAPIPLPISLRSTAPSSSQRETSMSDQSTSSSSVCSISGPWIPKRGIRCAEESIVANAYENEISSSCHLLWEQVMKQDWHTESNPYTKVNVLLISWAEDFDDLAVKDEVDALDELMRDHFNFHVQSTHLTNSAGKRAQAQINHVVAQWVYEYEGPGTLLIVYYAGHGALGTIPGNLELAGSSYPGELRAHLDRVVWNRTEEILRDVSADVLVIFDCCHAGNLSTFCGEFRKFEYIAATSAGSTTSSPGKRSFTSAMIWALKRLSKHRRPFTTHDLLNHIRCAPHFPHNQIPILSERSITGNKHITLERLKTTTEAAEAPPQIDQCDDSAVNGLTLTLHFDFGRRPTEKDIEMLGKGFSDLFKKNSLQADRIRWGGMRLRGAAPVVGTF